MLLCPVLSATAGISIWPCTTATSNSRELTENDWGFSPWKSRMTGRNGPVRSKEIDRKSTRLNSSHANISYAVFCLKKKKSDHFYIDTSNANRASIMQQINTAIGWH